MVVKFLVLLGAGSSVYMVVCASCYFCLPRTRVIVQIYQIYQVVMNGGCSFVSDGGEFH